MKPFSVTRIKRNSAIALLLLWVFAIANACVLDPLSISAQPTVGGPSIIDAGNTTKASSVKVDRFTTSAIGGTCSQRSERQCLDASDGGPIPVISILTEAKFDQLATLPPAVAQLKAATSVDLVQRRIDDLRPLETAIALRVRYVRLAL